MTSIPVSASTKSFFMGTNAAVTSAGTDVSHSFSETLESQKSDGKTNEPETSPSHAIAKSGKIKLDRKVSKPDNQEVSSEDAISRAEKAAEAMADQMVKRTAEELGITEEEVLQILNDLSMTPMDLLNSENLQAVVLVASGENDNCSLVTDENLFSSYKNLANALDEVIKEVSQITGLSMDEVKDVFEKIGTTEEDGDVHKPGGLQTQRLAEEQPTTQPTDTQDWNYTEKALETAKSDLNSDDTQKVGDESEDGVHVLLERSLSEKPEKDASKDFTNGNSQNPLAENQMKQLTNAVTETAKETAGFFDTDTEMIMNQITDYMKSQVVDGISEIDMQLHPENLGTLHVKLTSKEGVVTAQFTAENDAVKAALESQMIQLKETFKEQGVSVAAIEVMVESNRFDENLNQNSNGSMQEESRQHGKSRSRRIHLGNLPDEENLSPEEALAAEILRNSGSTVDYTA
ncbi:MAG TPA: flagellar hook-length control protein FliK [Lachnospiraceae bacterium]|nr:flagellar hook-length control protein FliK [Lachnospiraceae bacterium]